MEGNKRHTSPSSWLRGGIWKLVCETNSWPNSVFYSYRENSKWSKRLSDHCEFCGAAVTFYNCTFYFWDRAYLWTHSACRTITTLGEWGLSIGSGGSQSECRKPVTGKPVHLSALTWYFTWLSSDPASHYLCNTIYNWDALCPVSSSSQGAPLCSAPLRQRRGVMAVANFHYITRMSSGFKVYILEGKLYYHSSFTGTCCLLTVGTLINLIRKTEPLLWVSYKMLPSYILKFTC